MDALLVARERGADGGAADEADDVGRDGAFRAGGKGFGELALGEVLLAELLAQARQLLAGQVLRTRAGEAQGLDLVAVLRDPALEGLDIVLGPRVVLPIAARDGRDMVVMLVDDDAGARAMDVLESCEGVAVREQDGAGRLRRPSPARRR